MNNMFAQSLYDTVKRYRTLHSDIIHTLPIVILMPHSACNCRCVMCDIWKGNKNLRQLTPGDISGLMTSLKKLSVRQVVMSGGEALLNPNFFRFCAMLREEKIRITLLSTGLTLAPNAEQLAKWVDDIIVSLDGDEKTHDAIRNIPGAFKKLSEGISRLRAIDPQYRVTSRTVIHRLNFRKWAAIVDSAKEMGIDQVSFLPADVSSHAFHREVAWDASRQDEILVGREELNDLHAGMESLINQYHFEFSTRFIAESPDRIRKIGEYYAAFYGINPFPYKKCNAPWVSTVVEADGTVRPCFFHEPLGNIREETLENILNSRESVRFRKTLDMDTNATCIKCVCYLNLPGRMNPGHK